MLTQYDILKYIKSSLATDITGVEFDDEKILDIVRSTTLPQFSQWVPDIHELTIDPGDETYRTDKSNEFKIIDPDNRRIISIENVIPSMSEYILHGHPIIGPMNFNAMPNFVIDSAGANSARAHSSFSMSYDFKPPNIIRVLPTMAVTGPFTVVYSREHAYDFSSIPLLYSNQFLKMALGHVMISMGRARTRFGSVSTPFGEINLNGDALLSDGRDLVNEAKEELQTITIPLVEIDIG